MSQLCGVLTTEEFISGVTQTSSLRSLKRLCSVHCSGVIELFLAVESTERDILYLKIKSGLGFVVKLSLSILI